MSTRFHSFAITALAVLCLGVAVSCSQGAELKWAFDQNVFSARLEADWLMQDQPDAGIRAKLFTGAEGAKFEAELVGKVLDQLEKDDEAEDFTGEELAYDVAVPADAVVGEPQKCDASAEGVAKLRERAKELQSAGVKGDDPRWRNLYRDACRARRARRLADLAENAPEFIYTKHYVIGASHYAYTEDVTDEAFNDYSRNRSLGGQIIRATLTPEGIIRNEVLVESPKGTVRDPDVSWDGRKILFSMRTDYVTDDFHVWEYDLDTKKTRQITSGIGVADVEPIYLPNDDIFFGSTRCTQITDCWWTEVANFYTCNPKGEFLRRLSFDQVTVNYPKLLDDGRIVYTRWDYNDRGQIYPQPLFQMNPDGTAQTEYYGNNSFFPTTIMHARGIPGSDKVVAVAGGHHTYQNGKLIVIDRSKGVQENQGATLIAPVRETPADKIDQYGQVGELFQYPFPLDDTTLLAAYLPEGGAWKYDVPFGLYWFDFDGRRELLAFDPAISCGQPMVLAERERPVMRPSQVDLNQTTGKYYVQDVYEGPGLQGIERGVVKALRVVSIEFRAAGIRSNGNSGPAGGALVCTPPAISHGTWDVKHVLGEVPVEEDGSAYFEVPAQTPVYFQLLDKNGDVVQTMRSWSTLQPGETFGCVGCHEPKGSIIENVTATGSATLALQKGVAQLKPVLNPVKGRFENGGFSFTRHIQPILDANCVSCHTGGKRADGSPAPFSLRGNEDVSPSGVEINEKAGRRFSEAYINLTQKGNHDGPWVKWIGIQEGPAMLPPYVSGAAKSPLIGWLRDGWKDEHHKDVKLDDKSIRTLALWIDLLVPYCGDYVEENNWKLEERAQYEYYWTKRVIEDGLNVFNTSLKRLADELGSDAPGKECRNIEFGGLEDRRTFYAGFHARRAPSAAKRTGAQNVYRNVALNPRDVQTDDCLAPLFPHATSNSEYAFADEFAAKNVIDGRSENTGHGPKFPSWGPNLRTDLWLNVDFGCEVEIDKAVIWLRADFPHDGFWKKGVLEFSDGSKETIELKQTAEPQTFTFEMRRVKSVRLTGLETDTPEKWCGVTEIEFWGVSVE